jgi:hypothetical protein
MSAHRAHVIGLLAEHTRRARGRHGSDTNIIIAPDLNAFCEAIEALIEERISERVADVFRERTGTDG